MNPVDRDFLIRGIRTLATIAMNRLHLVPYPSYCTYLVTWRCNAKCEMCSIWKRDAGYELALEEIRRVFSQMKNMDAVRLTGGEPFLRDDLAEIANSVIESANPRIVHVTTNGFLPERTEKFIRKISFPEKFHIKISIDGIEKTHDKIRGVSGAYKKALKTLRILSKLKTGYNFYLGVNQTIVNRNSMEDTLKLGEICKDYGAELFVSLAYDGVPLYGDGSNHGLSVDFRPFSDFTKEDLKEYLLGLSTRTSGIHEFLERLVRKYYLEGLINRLIHYVQKPNPSCTALRSHIRILPDGSVPICLYKPQIVGSLRTERFLDMWFDRRAIEARRVVEKCSGCWAECETIPNAIYSGDILRSL